MRHQGSLAPWRKIAIFVVKLVHSIIFLSIAASVLYVFYAGLANRRSRLVPIALGLALGESLIFTVNRFQCPLRAIAENIGAESGQVTDIFLPRWFADRIPYLFTPPLVVGIVAILRDQWITKHEIRSLLVQSVVSQPQIGLPPIEPGSVGGTG
jgi:heme/copper-type cytochrome/quinol oxidase subunit 1